MRVITDPIVDCVLFLLSRVLMPVLLRITRAVFLAAMRFLSLAFTGSLGQEAMDKGLGHFRTVVS